MQNGSPPPLSSNRQASLHTRFTLVLITVALGFLIFGGVTVWIIEKLKVNGPVYENIVRGKDLIADILPPPEYIIESYLLVLQIHVEKSPQKIQEFAQRINTLKKDYDDRHAFWLKEPLDTQTKKIFLEQANAPVERFYATTTNEYIPARLRGESAESILEKLRAAYAEHRQFIDQVVSITNSYNTEEEKRARTLLNNSRGVLIAIFALALGMSIFWLSTIRKQVIKTVDRSVQIMQRIAQGDLTAQISANLQTDVGGLEQAAENMRLSLYNLVKRVQDSIDNLQSNLRQLNQDTQSINENAQHQSDVASSVAAAIEEMSVSMEEISHHAAEAEGSAQNSQNLSHDGMETVEKTTNEMEQVAQVIQQSSSALEELGESSVEISSLVNTIRGIAEQTNLLALNAAIEAARAGESGRGFAVVADEVRKLAERTAQATQQITHTIQSVQTNTSRAIDTVNNGVDRVNRGVDFARQAGQSVNGLGEGASVVMRSVSDISNALKEQASANTSIAQSIENIADMAHRNHQCAVTTVQTVSQLEQLAAALRQEASRFRLQ